MNGIAMPRLVLPPALGAVTACLLILLMNWLISADEVRLLEPPPNLTVDFVKVREQRELPSKDDRPEPPIKVDPQPPRKIRPVDPVGGGVIQVVLTDPMPPVAPTPSGSGAALPVVKPAAIYPARALQRGIEGMVLVEYRITVSGGTDAVRIIESQPVGVFDSAAIDAVRRYRFRPQMIGGKPVSVDGVRERLVFELEGG